MNILPNVIRVLSILAALGFLLLLPVAFAFNDTGEPKATILAIYGGYALIGISVFVANEFMIRKQAFQHRSFRIGYRLFWACAALAAAGAWAVYYS
ncbi:hypothetical protein [Paenibacillus sacheonensis]|uniref:Uncharacterized protein n=1 Tax=Paenibacillus sacheonensis TaxID=742054 RepID=A0A7X4YMI0_9BACL|nr:hypothetical protein [Paenibacillus sacheonensis]MBM7564555.1 hypothetical protein [Paenibacillus sacheonensis]NBC69112.1 hypothetical protein [Paenibacillus sacheonensis]